MYHTCIKNIPICIFVTFDGDLAVSDSFLFDFGITQYVHIYIIHFLNICFAKELQTVDVLPNKRKASDAKTFHCLFQSFITVIVIIKKYNDTAFVKCLFHVFLHRSKFEN